jgi:diguanylate cyclase
VSAGPPATPGVSEVPEVPHAPDGPRDPLTGLPGRDHLLHHGPDVVARAHAAGARVAVLVLDLDGFKTINDSAGHHVGDRVLDAVAQRLVAASGPDDQVVRLGGDEFAVLAGPLDGRADGAARARALIEAVGSPLRVDDLALSVGVSVGVATSDVDGYDVDELLRAADQAMYAAKSAGTGLWRASTPDDQPADVARRLTRRLTADLASGRATDALVVEHQPQVRLDTGAVVGFEALARWDHPELGLLPAAQFVPLAERSGLMGPLTSRLLDLALDDLPGLLDAAPGSRLMLNVTRRHVLGHGLVDDLTERVRRRGLAPEHIVLGITEPVSRPPAGTLTTFAELARRGYELSICGFGTARSSLTALWGIPAVREVTIDRGLVAGLTGEDDAEVARVTRLVRAVVAAATALDVRVVAAGVEDDATAAVLREVGCDVVQGWWVAHPMRLPDVAAWCAARS